MAFQNPLPSLRNEKRFEHLSTFIPSLLNSSIDQNIKKSSQYRTLYTRRKIIFHFNDLISSNFLATRSYIYNTYANLLQRNPAYKTVILAV